MAADFNTPPTVIQFLDNIVYQINVTTTNSIGTFSLQGSNDYNVDGPTGTITNPGTWVDLDLGGGTPSVNAANDTIAICIQQMPFYAIRLAYTAGTPGTGTCNVFLNAKQVGA